ncbi:hypothetical protein LWI29_008303 [Acer saccharum]|uniref:Reverse transcriptase zinc-binding domain-containing protein n=1 Tax=Acer saccharum TaxID=4024 RepID=A0AA39VDU5_ACESA|nr:hypothetical protein LWI29_008303 [Acer saccharum]
MKSGCSYIWRSLIWGRNLLAKGLRWRIGDGSFIRVFKDQWIPRPTTFRPISPDPGVDLRVADLIDRVQMGWNFTKLNQYLLPIDRSVIASIPVSRLGGKDFLAWHYDNKGRYTVRSGYRLAIQEKIQESSSNSASSRKWWTALWNLHIPPKVRIFIWRVCLNAISSRVNLFKRKVVDNNLCMRCKLGAESSDHAIFGCTDSRKVWSRTRFDSFFDNLTYMSVLDTLLLC